MSEMVFEVGKLYRLKIGTNFGVFEGTFAYYSSTYRVSQDNLLLLLEMGKDNSCEDFDYEFANYFKFFFDGKILLIYCSNGSPRYKQMMNGDLFQQVTTE